MDLGKEIKDLNEEYNAYMEVLAIVLIFIISIPRLLFQTLVVGFFRMIRL